MPPLASRNEVAGFYVNWDDNSYPALKRALPHLDWVIPGWLSLEGPDLELKAEVEAAERLRTGGYLLCEFGYGQDIEIEALIDQTAGLTFLEFKRDLQGIARTAVIKRTP